MCNGKSDKDFVKLKLLRDPTSITSDHYEFKMSLFDHVEPEEFLFFIINFNINLATTVTLVIIIIIILISSIKNIETVSPFFLVLCVLTVTHLSVKIHTHC